jgi:hypothetical protein
VWDRRSGLEREIPPRTPPREHPGARQAPQGRGSRIAGRGAASTRIKYRGFGGAERSLTDCDGSFAGARQGRGSRAEGRRRGNGPTRRRRRGVAEGAAGCGGGAMERGASGANRVRIGCEKRVSAEEMAHAGAVAEDAAVRRGERRGLLRLLRRGCFTPRLRLVYTRVTPGLHLVCNKARAVGSSSAPAEGKRVGRGGGVAWFTSAHTWCEPP